jgi:catechol 2,3-dioxygenase-like lactoylglutathione lyase family enzyme
MRVGQVMVFAKDMARMSAFYRDGVGLVPVEDTRPDEWIRFDAGGVLFALHAIPAEVAKHIAISDPPKRRGDTAIKFTFHVADVEAARQQLLAHGAQMSEIARHADLELCDGLDPEGNVFQIANR